jgi:hypothetical protein
MTACWICNQEEGTTGEHRSKRSDIKAELNTTGSVYLHTETQRNEKLQSINATKLKFQSPLCNRCNSQRTQPHDRAWEKLSQSLRTRRPGIRPGDIIRANRIFPYDTSTQMLNVHLWFVKWLGCQVAESKICIDPGIDSLADAIINGKAHSNIWLAYGCAHGGWVGASNLDTARLNARSSGYDYHCRFYTVGHLAVRVRLSHIKLKDDWHPQYNNRFTLADFTYAPQHK